MDNKEPQTTNEAIIATLVNFVNRVASGYTTSDEEIKILPEIVQIILNNEC